MYDVQDDSVLYNDAVLPVISQKSEMLSTYPEYSSKWKNKELNATRFLTVFVILPIKELSTGIRSN